MKTFRLFIIGAGLLATGCATSHSTWHNPHPAFVAPSPAANVLIISATYGSGTNYTDVTDRVNDLLRQPEAEFFARPEWLDADPTPGWNKALVIVYEFKRQRHTFATGEGGKVSIPVLIKQAKE